MRRLQSIADPDDEVRRAFYATNYQNASQPRRWILDVDLDVSFPNYSPAGLL